MADDILNEFINEAREHLATIETDLLTIEEAGADIDVELVNKVFRAAHSIKGGSGFLGLNRVKELAHKAETVLDMIRSKKMVPNAEITNILLSAFDRLRDMINNTDRSESQDIDDLASSLTALASSYLPAEMKNELNTATTLTGAKGCTASVSSIDFERVKRARQFVYCIDYDLVHDVEKQGKNILQIFRDILSTGEILDCFLDFDAVGTLETPVSNKLPLRLVFATVMDPDIIDGLFAIASEKIKLLFDPRRNATSPAAASAPVSVVAPVEVTPPAPVPVQNPVLVGAPKQASRDKTPSGPGAARSHADETLRVNVDLLESLMNLAGELVLSRNQLRASIAEHNPQALSNADQRINQVTSELQNVIMQTRLQPIGNVFAKFPRVVRDMAMALGKEINLDIRGKDVALDRSLIEGLSDPLTHMVRNSVDHGIESPEERRAAGKEAVGTVRIEARHEAGQVIVEIADDGKGIDPKRIAEAAVSKGLISAEKVRGMSDHDKIALIFLPGLSTAEKVTDISGRGVGMDVVKTNLDRLGGKVEIQSQAGKGSLFRIKLPLTLAIIPSLIVSVGKEQFAIPQINIDELIRIPAEEIKRRIEIVGDAEVLLLRDSIIPIVRFDRVLGLVPTYRDPKTGVLEVDRRTNLADRRSPRHGLLGDDGANGAPASETKFAAQRRTDGRRSAENSALEIAVVTTGTTQYGMVVTTFHNTEEIVVKPLGRHLKTLREYAGATILGNGTVALIIDVAGLAAKVDLAAVSGSKRAEDLAAQAARERLENVQSYLVYHNGPNEPCATPLDSVLRLERITPEQIEMKGGRRTMQYRGATLPLVTLSDSAKVNSIESERDLAVIVSSVNGREVGLLGAMPIDVVESKIVVDQLSHRQKGVAGSAIIRDKTTLITDMFEMVEAVYPEWNSAATKKRSDSGAGKQRCLLLAEDSDFFRAQVKRFLEDDGYAVIDAPDGQAAWEELLKHLGEVSAVVTDIEMPRLTGLELAARIKADPRTTSLRILALTSLAGEDDIARGKEAGIDDYQVKLDRDRLLESVRSLFAPTAK